LSQTIEQRKHFCLKRFARIVRLAPDLYLGGLVSVHGNETAPSPE